MKRLGPWLTLAAVAVLGLVLLVINMSKDTEPSTANTNAVVTTTTGPTTQAPPTTPPSVPFPGKADYVGTIPLAAGRAITLEITVAGDKATAYACDGKAIESWLQGSATNGSLQLTGKNDAELTGAFNGKTVQGILRIGGKQWDYTAAPVQPPAGLYVYSDAGTRQSWIVDANGGVTGVQRNPDGSTASAVTLAPDATALVNGKKVTANKVSGGDSVG
ncbi:hypothetical protein OG874_04210 [Nocardia sp. NBC_00565]|uniref:hypothetical protein n=1 Tax=Nocardia sp. NBC_00565 TaxID=2975993 RepID=UPI002E809968|nr:hypothetical protein [Nocardia sp. NBC_00565]WUC04416.1 hypothetical protein OG874_04210 [Nocardia sp. NBC_00565]